MKPELHAALFCMHRPKHSEAAVTVAGKILRAARPTHIWFGGDLADCKAVSYWEKRKRSEFDEMSFQREIDDTHRYLAKIRKQHPKAAITWIEGNHEIRMPSYLAKNAPPLLSLRALHMPELYELDDIGVEYVAGPQTIARGNFMLKHGKKYGENAGKKEVEAEGKSGMCSHNHRTRLHSHTFRGRKPVLWWHGGCLCQLEPDYVSTDSVRNWQHAVNLISVRGGLWNVEQIMIHNGRAVWRGKEYTA